MKSQSILLSFAVGSHHDKMSQKSQLSDSLTANGLCYVTNWSLTHSVSDMVIYRAVLGQLKIVLLKSWVGSAVRVSERTVCDPFLKHATIGYVVTWLRLVTT